MRTISERYMGAARGGVGGTRAVRCQQPKKQNSPSLNGSLYRILKTSWCPSCRSGARIGECEMCNVGSLRRGSGSITKKESVFFSTSWTAFFFWVQNRCPITNQKQNKSPAPPPPHHPNTEPVVRHIHFSNLATLTGRVLVGLLGSILRIIMHRCVFLGNLLFFAYFFALCRLPGALFWSKIVLWSLQNPITFLQTLLATAWPVVCFLRVFVGGGGGEIYLPFDVIQADFFFIRALL